MADRPIDLMPLLSPRTQRSYLDAAVRLADGADAAEVLGRLAPRLVDIATVWGCLVRLLIEPEGDACETGHYVEIDIEHGILCAHLTAWPERFGGAVPAQIDAELELAGWVLLREGGDPDPINRLFNVDPAHLTPEQLAEANLPARRLVAVVGEDDLQAWADEVVAGTRRVVAPKNDRWFMLASAEEEPGGKLSERFDGPTEDFAGSWTLNLGPLLYERDWEVAVWPSDGEVGAICCDLGLHEYHEPPCPPPPPWSTRAGSDEDADEQSGE